FFFNSGAGADTVRGIASWDGINLSRLGKGLDYFNISSTAGPVYSIVRFQNEIYVAGATITMAGDYWVNGIAKWNGTVWDTIAGGVLDNWNNRGAIYDMEVINNELYIAGGFTKVGISQIPANGLAKYDGVQWSAVNNFPQWDYNFNNINIVDAIVEYNGELYVGGRFSDSNPIDSMYNIAKWNGSNWEQIANGIAGGFSTIEDMVVFQGKLYVAGAFSKNDNPSNPGNRIAAWNGSNWEQVGNIWGITPTSFAFIDKMTIFNNELWVVGNFQKVGNMYSPHIAKYNGTTWCSVGDTFNLALGASAVYNNKLYVGGAFTMINSDNISQMAKWMGGNFVDSCEIFVGVNEELANNHNLLIYPNPTENELNIEFYVEGKSDINISIHNVVGQKIYDEQVQNCFGSCKKKISTETFANGIYVISINFGEGTVVKKIVKQ
ncbi:MAG: T9SS type A sorting domain-containing protein, partial [Flavobacteriales bacterium]|nr:T9SS type A sorting domain-containing protein [Flavobacteriales bacterium]